jgi:hypothetical protein
MLFKADLIISLLLLKTSISTLLQYCNKLVDFASNLKHNY